MQIETLPPDCEHLSNAWAEHRASVHQRTAQPRRDARRIIDLSVAMSTCTLAEILAAVERHSLMGFAEKPGGEPKLSVITSASMDAEYVEALKEMALPLRRVSYLDAFEALRARMVLANMVSLNADPGKPTPLESELEAAELETC